MPGTSPVVWSNPSTWPWFVYIWIAFLLAGAIKPAWRWLQRNRGESWPVLDGRIDTADFKKPGFSLIVTRGHFAATIVYSYSFSGTSYTGRYTREFPAEHEAEEFVHDLAGRSLQIHYDPEKPSRSMLLESDVDLSLQGRGSRPLPPPRPNPFSIRTRLVFRALSVLAGIGLAVSLWVHLGAVMGQRVAPASFFWMLHAGIFVVWFPAVLAARALTVNLNQKYFWKIILKDSPAWVRYMVYGFGAYAIINFLYFIAKTPNGGGGNNLPAAVWRGFSGHWMAFYSAAFAILYSAGSAKNQDSLH